MRSLELCAASLLLYPCIVSGQNRTLVQKVDRTCGYLLQEKVVSSRKPITAPEFSDPPLAKTIVAVYSRGEDSDCCLQVKKIAETTTSRNGRFGFKKVPTGNYWIVWAIEGHEFQVPIEFKPTIKNPSDRNGFLYTVDRSGNIAMKAIVTVD